MIPSAHERMMANLAKAIRIRELSIPVAEATYIAMIDYFSKELNSSTDENAYIDACIEDFVEQVEGELEFPISELEIETEIETEIDTLLLKEFEKDGFSVPENSEQIMAIGITRKDLTALRRKGPYGNGSAIARAQKELEEWEKELEEYQNTFGRQLSYLKK